MLPLLWLAVTAIKSRLDSISTTPKLLPVFGAATLDRGSIRFDATLQGFVALGEVYSGAANAYYHHLFNTLIIGSCSTIGAVLLGTCCAYGFSRFHIPGARDWLFFILSTRFLPPLAVVIPILMMYRSLDLSNTHLGLIILYTAFNLSLAVWLMKGFIDDIPKAYEEAALVDGYTRWQAFVRVVLPRAVPGMALNNRGAVTVPVYFAGLQGNPEGMPWSQVGAGVLLFVAPIVLFTVLARRHLLRGVTFGTIKQ
jgi:multiple sugar transport system permease protein